jgi:hypothetical protein
MTSADLLHAEAVELSDQIADELRMLRPERDLLAKVDRLKELLVGLVEVEKAEAL